MAKDLKGEWKETGKGLGKAFENLGKSIYKSGKHALRHVDAWATSEDNNAADKKQNKKQ